MDRDAMTTPAKFTLRPLEPRDVSACARIWFDAFTGIAKHHGFPSDMPSVAEAERLAGEEVHIGGELRALAVGARHGRQRQPSEAGENQEPDHAGRP